MKQTITLFILLFICSSFGKRKPHLIVGGWQAETEYQMQFKGKKMLDIYQWTFRSDELMMHVSLKKNKKEKYEKFYLAFKVIEELDEVDKSVLLLRSTCDEELFLAFTINELTKSSLELQFISEVSSDPTYFSDEIMRFERISGPPENVRTN